MFFQTSAAPDLGGYNLSASQVGSAVNYAPDAPLATPEPTSLLLLGPGLVGGACWLQRRRTSRPRPHA